MATEISREATIDILSDASGEYFGMWLLQHTRFKSTFRVLWGPKVPPRYLTKAPPGYFGIRGTLGVLSVKYTQGTLDSKHLRGGLWKVLRGYSGCQSTSEVLSDTQLLPEIKVEILAGIWFWWDLEVDEKPTNFQFSTFFSIPTVSTSVVAASAVVVLGVFALEVEVEASPVRWGGALGGLEHLGGRVLLILRRGRGFLPVWGAFIIIIFIIIYYIVHKAGGG
jgi:hypothetical protein